MDDTLFAALDRMVEAGGSKLAKKVIIEGLEKKSQHPLIEALKSHQYIRDEGKGKFTITDEGRKAWDGKAGDARKQELKDRIVVEFLNLVVKQNGKALKAKQLEPFDADFIVRLRDDGLIVETGENKYKLSGKGEEFQQAREPLDVQLNRLKLAAKDLLTAPQALLLRFARDTEQLAEGGAIRAAFTEARSAVQEQVARAQADFERSLDGLQAFGSLIAAAQTFKKELPATVSGAMKRIDEAAETVQQLEADRRKTAEQFRQELDKAREEMERLAAAAEEKARQAMQATATPAPSRPVSAEPSEEVVWQATRRAYEYLEQQFRVTSELIKVPKLTDLVRAELPTLTAPQFHELLQRWHRDDRLVLQVCSDPHFEPRSKEGIHSSRGLLFYVELR